MNKQKFFRYIGYIGASLYVIFGFFLLFIFTEYIIQNIISLSTNGSFIENTELTVQEEFFIDASILIFFISSLIFTFSRIFLYYFPELRRPEREEKLKPSSSPFEVIMHVSTDEERKVIEELMKEKKLFKFELARRTNLSKMKIHRIVTRLAERDIVVITKIGRNSQVALSHWMRREYSS